jgi:hypothetical protein
VREEGCAFGCACQSHTLNAHLVVSKYAAVNSGGLEKAIILAGQHSANLCVEILEKALAPGGQAPTSTTSTAAPGDISE